MSLRNIFALLLSAASLLLLGVLYFQQQPDVQSPLTKTDEAVPYEQRDWNTGTPSSLNISVYTFRDHNRNGLFDVGDFPLASVAVRMVRPDEATKVASSNINGFGNFKMSLGRAHPGVDAAGDYRFETMTPPGWVITSDNAVQVSRFIELPGSVAGVVSDSPPAPVGLAPELRAFGQVVSGGERPVVDTDIELVALAPDGNALELSADTNGYYSFTVQPGDWVLNVRDKANGRVHSRPFAVRDVPVQLATIALSAPVLAPLPQAIIQDFEYLERSPIDKIANGQSGLKWDYLLAVDNQLYRGPGYVNVLRSGNNVGYNSSGHPVTVAPDRGETFDFVGAYFAVAWPEAEGEILIVEAFRGGQLVARDEVALSVLGPVWLQADYNGIDQLRLGSGHYWQFVTDDMQFRLPQASSGSAAVD
jgi:hypothetical protein